MLSKTTYPLEHVERARSSVDEQLAVYDRLAAAVAGTPAESELSALEPAYFEAALLALDARFVHRARALELKDGNPLNEARLLVEACADHGGVLTAQKSIRYRPEAAVLGLAVGEPVVLTRDGFERLAAAYLAEIEAKFS